MVDEVHVRVRSRTVKSSSAVSYVGTLIAIEVLTSMYRHLSLRPAFEINSYQLSVFNNLILIITVWYSLSSSQPILT